MDHFKIIYQVQLQVIPVEENTGLGLNILLYLGLGMAAIGLVMVFVGVGEKGFKTVEMRLLGPGLVVSGLSLACVRIFCCLLCDGACQDDMEEDEHDGAFNVASFRQGVKE